MPPNRLHLQINPYDSNSNKTMHLHGYAKQVILALCKNMPETDDVIWVDEVHPTSGRAAIVHDDGRACWLYLHEFPNGPVLKSVLVYSPIPPITRAEFDSTMRRGDTVILMRDYASPDAVIVDRFPDDFSFRWRPDGDAVAVIFRDRVLAIVTPDEQYGSSAAIARSGPFGDPLVLEHYNWLKDAQQDAPSNGG